MTGKALIIVDIQNDFCQGGALEVPDAEAILPLANALQEKFPEVIATLDWHPNDHISFAANHVNKAVGDMIKVDGFDQILWPTHCVQNSSGAAFHPQLDLKRVKKIVHKGVDKFIDSYSAFFDNEHLRSTGLADYLREKGIEEVYIIGLATDYCVKYSSIDAAQLGFRVFVITDACRGVELKPGDVAASYREMEQAGVTLLHAAEVLSPK